MRRELTFVGRVVAVAIAFGGLNLLGARLQVEPGVALLFPASAFGVVAGFLWRREAAIGVFAGTFATPWDPTNSLATMLLYSLGNSLEAVLPSLAIGARRHRNDFVAFGKITLWGAVINTGANVVVSRGSGWIAGTHAATPEAFAAALEWWVADALAILLLGFPALLYLRPEIFFRDGRYLRWGFLRGGRATWTTLAMIVAVSILLYAWDSSFRGSFTWPALLYLVPITVLLLRWGVAGAVAGAAVVAVAYLATLGLESRTGVSPLQTPDLLVPVYGNLVVFAVFAGVAGTIRSRNMVLVEQLRERWERLQETMQTTVRALAAVIEAKDPTTEQHLERVSRMVLEIGRRIGLPQDDLDRLYYGAVLHDVGKVGTPRAILLKPGPLSAEERRIMEEHIDVGARILERTGLGEEIVALVRYHEERWDGGVEGRFPGRFGLAGAAIPLGARIIAVADAYDAMTSDRPYRAAMTPLEAIEEMEREAGRQFDPDLVGVVREILADEGRLPRRTVPSAAAL